MKGLDACIAFKTGDEWTVDDYWFENGFDHVSYDKDTELGGTNECTVLAREEDGKITFEITKEITSCDTNDSEYNDGAYILLAWSSHYSGNKARWHGRDTRGGAHVELYTGRMSETTNPVLSTLDFDHTFNLTGTDTQFWCIYKEVDLSE